MIGQFVFEWIYCACKSSCPCRQPSATAELRHPAMQTFTSQKRGERIIGRAQRTRGHVGMDREGGPLGLLG